MSNLNTELLNTLLKNESVDEFFRQLLEDAINDLLQAELSACLGYEKYDSDGWGSGNSRNGSYSRTFDTRYGKLKLQIPRDRNGEFHQHTLPPYSRRTDDLETTISNISKTVESQVEAFHKRTVPKRYAVIYCDATYLNLRRDSVAKEALHVLLGITPEGYKEIIDYAIYPSESALNYEDMLSSLKERGLEEVLLFVSDGLSGISDALKRQFPKADHQSCWVHLSRSVSRLVREKDRSEVLDELKTVYTQSGKPQAKQQLENFLKKYKTKYPKIEGVFSIGESLFSYYSYPEEIRRSIYTSNLIENCNKGLKHKTKVKEQFPNESSLDRFVCSYYSDYNRKNSERIHNGFKKAEEALEQMFEERYRK